MHHFYQKLTDMNKLIFKQTILLVLILLVGFGCSDSRDISPSEVLIINDIRDSVSRKFIQTLLDLPEYKIWNARKRERRWRNYTEIRKLLIGNKVYYHIELIQNYSNELTSSSMPLPEVVCYFRADPKNNSIKIVQTETKEFLDLFSEPGYNYLKVCFAKN